MNIPKYSLENRKVIYFFLAILLIGGVISFFKLPKKEDAPFVIKTAVLVTQYPGANPHEVEKLITEPIEREIQSMTDVYQIKSESYFGLSKISIELQPTIDPDYMPVKWDELRRKVANIQPKLPSGASTITVNDDFGDVYGIYYALTADEGFSYTDLRDWAQRIRTQLTPIEGVQKVMLYGEQTEVINVKISTSKLSALGIDPTSIMGILQKQNIQVNTGDIATEIYQLRLRTEGTYTSLEDIENQLIISKDGREVRLGDIATVERGYYDPPSTLMRVNGKRAIGIGVASGAKDNVVAVGKAVDERLAEIEQLLPIGIELASLYPEDKIADEANNGFILNLIESLVIVILIIFVVMGSRAGMLIGSSLLFSVGGTLLIMLMWGVGLNRTSLAAFIIAMGMLVDNAIVVTDNAQTLLFLQAYCDLSLPDYTSKIINVGIQQKGIEDSVPDKLRDSTLQNLQIFMDEDQKKEVSQNYTQEDDTWLLNDDISKETRENLNEDFSKAMMMVAAFSEDSEQGQAMAAQMGLPEGTDPLTALAQMPEEAVQQIMSQVDERLKDMPESIVTQAGVSFVASEYEALGKDVDAIQMHYILMSGIRMLAMALVIMLDRHQRHSFISDQSGRQTWS